MPTLTPLVPVASTTEFVPRAGGVIAAGADIFESKLLAGDANPAFQILGNGKLEWGAGGASALDVNLYRFAANILGTDDRVLSARSTTADISFDARLSSDSATRFIVRANGQLEWGDGTATPDTVLRRTIADVLLLEGGMTVRDQLIFDQQVGAANILFAGRSGEGTPYRFIMTNDGRIEWGAGGGAARDIALYRISANRLQIDDAFLSSRVTAGSTTWESQVDGDSTARFVVGADGALEWGPGNAVRDTILRRQGGNALRLDTADALWMGDATAAGGSYIQFFEQTADPAAGALNTARLFAKDNGAGKTQLVVRFNTGATQVIATEP